MIHTRSYTGLQKFNIVLLPIVVINYGQANNRKCKVSIKNREESSTHVFCFKIGRQIAEKMGPNAWGGAT